MNLASLKALSPAAAAYAHVVADPYFGPLIGIPDFPPLNTAVRRMYARGTFTTGAALSGGFGYIVMMPELGLVNDQQFVVTSSAGTLVNVLDPTAAGATPAYSNAEFVSAQIGTRSLQARVVAAGLRIRNVTSKLARGGQIVGLQEPAHQNLATVPGTVTLANLLSYDESGFFDGASGSWTHITYRPATDNDTNFITAIPPGAYYMVFAVQGPDTTGANPQTYEYEAYVVGEYLGTVPRGKQPSPCDVAGYAAVSSVSLQSRTLQKPHQQDPHDVGRALQVGADVHTNHANSAPGRGSSSTPSSGWDKVLDLVEGALPAVGGLLSSLLA